MREIKFREKRKDNNKWIKGYYFYNKQKNKHYIISVENDLLANETLSYEIKHIFEVDSKTICQYTEMKDKNNKEIYENNICKSKDGDLLKIVFVNGQFRPQFISGIYKNYDNGFPPLKHNWNKYIEVVGNIFDDSKLLKGEKL